ncbi:MAG: hypothetical protein N3A54_06875, partial [Patescibacteria group bacterium]|nr:hypothetical protein [Patescibacteria group bacterium]
MTEEEEEEEGENYGMGENDQLPPENPQLPEEEHDPENIVMDLELLLRYLDDYNKQTNDYIELQMKVGSLEGSSRKKPPTTFREYVVQRLREQFEQVYPDKNPREGILDDINIKIRCKPAETFVNSGAHVILVNSRIGRLLRELHSPGQQRIAELFSPERTYVSFMGDDKEGTVGIVIAPINLKDGEVGITRGLADELGEGGELIIKGPVLTDLSSIDP